MHSYGKTNSLLKICKKLFNASTSSCIPFSFHQPYSPQLGHLHPVGYNSSLRNLSSSRSASRLSLIGHGVAGRLSAEW